nr:T9SS type B sorting domain-containing protein [Cytophagales bacterium]
MSAVAIDQLEIEIGGGFVYLNVDNVEFCTDTEAPAGYSVAIDQDPITTGIHNAVSFTFAGAEVGTIYNYTFSSSGGGANVTGSGTVTSPNQQITGINLSGLVEGTVTLNVTLTDASSNTGSPAIDTSAKILNTSPLATPPLAPVVNEDDLAVALSDAIQIADAENDNQVVTFTVVGGTVTLGTTGITFGGGLNGSSSFTASGTLAAINTSLDAATFTPTSDLFGTNAGSISFVSNDGTVNSNTATVTFDIAGVNDEPFITGLPSSVTVTEDAITDPFNISAVTISDIDAGSGVLTLKLEATGGVFDYASGTGILLTGQNSNAATFSGNLVDLNNYFNIPTNLYFKPNANLSGNGAATVSVFINDNGNTGSGGGTDVSAGTVSINITPVNDAPSDILLDNNSVAENEPVGTLVGSFSATDVDNGDTFTFTFAAGAGDVDNSAFSISDNELQTGAVFKFNTKNTYSIRVRVTDSGGLSLELPFTISITNVNDAPTVANPIDNQAATQDVLFEFVVPANTFEDVDGDILTYSVKLSGGGALPAWLSFDATTRTFSGTPSNTHVGTVGIDLSVSDGNGGSVTDSFDLVVANVNDAPTVANPIPNQNATEDAAFNFQFAANTFNDIDVGDALTYTAQRTGGGALPGWLSFDPVTRTFSGTPSNTNVGAVSLDVIANDGNGGSVTAMFDLVVASVNDAPIVSAPITVDVTEDIPTTLTGISFTDPDAGSSPVTATFSVASGTLAASSGNGVVVSGTSGSLILEGSVSDINAFIADGQVTFTTALHATINVNLTISITDNGNTGSGGALNDQTSVTLSVTAVNDAPVNTIPGAQQTDQNVALVFSSGNGSLISVSDVDAGGETIKLSLSATNGMITLSSTSGLIFTLGSGVNFSNMEFEGTLANINTALSGMAFTPTSGFNGPASLTITSDDQGFFGSGGAQTDTDVVSITVISIIPVVTGVTSSAVNGGYKVGDELSILVNFDQAIIVNTTGGDPTLTLETGGTDREASYLSGSGSNTLVFAYTVQQGDTSSDLDYTATNALVLNGGTIENISGDAALITLPPTGSPNSLSGQKNLQIDGVIPVIASVSVPADRTYVAGETLDFTVNFSEAVVVNGNPEISLTLGSTTRVAGYGSGSGTSSLVFSYTIQSGDLDDNGIAVASLSLNGGTIRDAAGNAANLSMNGVGSTQYVLVDAVVPSVVDFDLDILSLAIGETATLSVTFTEAIIGLTTGSFTVANGSLSNLTSSDGGVSWTVIFTPDNAVEDDTNVITLESSAYTDLAGNNGLGTASSANYLVDTKRPSGTVVVDKTQLIIGESSLVTISFSEAVTGLTGIDFTVENGSLSDLSSSDGGIVWTALLIPQPGVEDATNLVSLDNTGFEDAAGNSGSGVSVSNNYSVDTDIPKGYSVSIVPARINGINETEFSFYLVDGELTADFYYSISSSGGGTPIAGIGSVNSANQLIKDIDVSSLPDGVLTIRVTLTDSSGNTGEETTDTVDKILPAVLTVSMFNPADEDGVDGEFEVVTDNLFAANTTITIQMGGTATPGADYQSLGTSFVFPANTSRIILPIVVVDDLIVEGNETVIVSLIASDNSLVTIGQPSQATLTIADNDLPSPLTVTIEAKQQKVYGLGDPARFNYTVTGFVNGDDESILTGKPERAAGEDVGNYAINLGSLTAGGNYTINFVGADFEIIPATLNIAAVTGQTKIYGDANPLVAYTATGFVNGDDESILTGKLERAAGEDVGSYAINLGSLSAGGNYTINFVGADFEITPATLNITAVTGQTKIYGDANPIVTYTASGFENGDDESILNGKLERAAGEDVGSYAINLGSLSAGSNYTLAYTGAEFGITPRSLSVVADPNQGKVYGENDPGLTFSANGFATGDDEGVLTGALVRVAGERINSYTIQQGSLNAGANYMIDFTSAVFQISPAVLAVNAEDKTKVYGAANPPLTFTFSGFVAGDDEQLLSGSLTREAGEGVGIYAITLGTLTAGMNYTIQFVGADFEIIPAELAVLMQPSPVETAWGISPTLPTTIMVMTADGQFLELPVTWDVQTLYIFGRGVYPVTAAFNLPAGILNSNDLTPEIVVTVLPKPAPEDIVIDNNRFEAEAGQNVIAIGVLSVIDPIDDQHEITLSNLAYDNVYFAIDNGTLFWNSQESAAGKTAFKILVRAVDRDGNMLEKEFTITRNRTSVNTIEIFNTFTPNGDNVNDTWGVDELRFYQNVRIQVFERSGKRVFYTENPDVRWDGMFDGIDLPVATYYWTIQVGETGEIRKGMLNLIRN